MIRWIVVSRRKVIFLDGEQKGHYSLNYVFWIKNTFFCKSIFSLKDKSTQDHDITFRIYHGNSCFSFGVFSLGIFRADSDRVRVNCSMWHRLITASLRGHRNIKWLAIIIAISQIATFRSPLNDVTVGDELIHVIKKTYKFQWITSVQSVPSLCET